LPFKFINLQRYAAEEDWESEVSAVWAAAGASEIAIQRLLILGAKWQKGELGEIYRDAEAVACMVRTLEELLPGVGLSACHSTPGCQIGACNLLSLPVGYTYLSDGYILAGYCHWMCFDFKMMW
jgi:hypothetical protein